MGSTSRRMREDGHKKDLRQLIETMKDNKVKGLLNELMRQEGNEKPSRTRSSRIDFPDFSNLVIAQDRNKTFHIASNREFKEISKTIDDWYGVREPSSDGNFYL